MCNDQERRNLVGRNSHPKASSRIVGGSASGGGAQQRIIGAPSAVVSRDSGPRKSPFLLNDFSPD